MTVIASVCQHCKVSFSYVRPARGPLRKFCKQQCGVAWHNAKARTIAKTEKFDKPNICAQCGEQMIGRRRKYCAGNCVRLAFNAKRASAYVPHPLPTQGVRIHIDKMVCLYQGGATLEEIGTLYDVTRERVRQILKQSGFTRANGGSQVRLEIKSQQAEIARQKKVEARNRRYLSKHGMSFDDFAPFNDSRKWGGYTKTPFFLFKNQRRNAKQRGIGFEFNFADWWAVWQESGKWDQRGRTGESYVMCRLNDEGPYKTGNVYIDTLRNNSILGRTLAFEHEKPKTALYQIVQAAGGRKAVSDATDSPRQYISSLAITGSFPKCWIEDGRIQRIADLTAGTYSKEQIIELAAA